MRQMIHGLPILFCVTGLVLAAEPKQAGHAIKVECHGQLRHGVVAIGGETTGTTISFNRITWELKLPDDTAKAFAYEHHKQPVTAVGTLRRVEGTQIPVRWIMEVDRLGSPDTKSSKSEATATVTGMLRQADTVAGQPATLVIDANGTVLPLDFEQAEKLADKAKSLIGKLATVTGEVVRAAGPDSSRSMQIRVTKLDHVDVTTRK